VVLNQSNFPQNHRNDIYKATTVKYKLLQSKDSVGFRATLFLPGQQIGPGRAHSQLPEQVSLNHFEVLVP